MFRIEAPMNKIEPVKCPICECYILNKDELPTHVATHNEPIKVEWRKSQYDNKTDILWWEKDRVLYQILVASGESEDSKYKYKLSGNKKWIQRIRR